MRCNDCDMKQCPICREFRQLILFVGEGENEKCVHCAYDPPPSKKDEREVCECCGRKKPGRHKQ